ncbi:glucose dehydrogenase [FAD, quinone]-like, partial [Anoplophora glabripennis]|uniref:glucose dehydrogenase [FAD, quinone]-like n=1 Tax=Anoplophora glabripennis TaxID=217634 RepID=UPI0008737B48
VLLLEAGDEEPEIADVPAFPPLLQRSSLDWRYVTQPSPHSCLARDNGQCNWARGKVMGGTSTINYMIYIRGHPKDFDEWQEEGNKGWSYADVLPYFIKSEDNRNLGKVEAYYHGSGGYQTVEYFPYQDENTLAILKAYQELGLEYLDQNTERMIGTSLLQHTTRDGERLSTNGAFIRPIRNNRKNLAVQPNSHATRVLIDPKTKTAFGVEYLHKGKLVQAIAHKEVILSAGSLNSPILLMLSGIGPAHHLEENNIHVLKDLAVGFNLQDHTTIDGVVFQLTNYSATIVSDEERKKDVFTWKQAREGPLSGSGPLQANAFIQTKYEKELGRPDIQISMDAVNVDNFLKNPILTYNTAVLPLAYYNGLMARPILLGPESRGRVLLNSSDPVFGHPVIHANTFFEEIDLLRIVEGAKQSLNLENTEIFKHYGIEVNRTPLPACEHLYFGTDEYWACVAMAYTTTIFHPVGTCKMGPKHDVSAVVDSELRVHGIKNLRVIDASIMPKIVHGNTNAAVIMIGERGSDFVKSAWLKDNHGNQGNHGSHGDYSNHGNHGYPGQYYDTGFDFDELYRHL